MVSGMADEATPVNIPTIVSRTRGVGREIETHILEFLRSSTSDDSRTQIVYPMLKNFNC